MEKVPPQVCFNSQEGNWKDNVSQASDSITSSMNSSLKAGIDNFVDKLEKLMAARSRQYEERVKMEKEREKRKKERREKRPQTRRSRRSDKNRSKKDKKYQALPDTEDNDEDTFANEDIELCESITNNKKKQHTSTLSSSAFSPDIKTTDPIKPADDTNNAAKTNNDNNGQEKKADITTQIDDLLNLMADDDNDDEKKVAASPTQNPLESIPESPLEAPTVTSPDPLLGLVSHYDNSNFKTPQKEVIPDGNATNKSEEVNTSTNSIASVTLMTGIIPTKEDQETHGNNHDAKVELNEKKSGESTNDTITKSPNGSTPLLAGSIPTVIVDDSNDNIQNQKDNKSTTNDITIVQNDMSISSPTNVNLHKNSSLPPVPVTPSPPSSPQTKITDDSQIKSSDTDESNKMISSVIADCPDENNDTSHPKVSSNKVGPVDVALSPKQDNSIDLNPTDDSSIQTPTSGVGDDGINTTSLTSKGEGKDEVSDITSGDHTAKQVETSTQ